MLLAATTGMRRGELLGLRWRDVDVVKGEVRVTRSLEQTKTNGLAFKPPKPKRGRRTIPLLPFTLAPLPTHRAGQKEDRVKAGSMWEDNDLVCCRADGTPIDPDRFSKDFAALAQRAALGVRPHDLRHTYLSQLLNAGVPVAVVSKRAGHKNAYVTLAIYAHPLSGMQEEAIKQLDAALRPHLRIGQGYLSLIGWQTGWQVRPMFVSCFRLLDCNYLILLSLAGLAQWQCSGFVIRLRPSRRVSLGLGTHRFSSIFGIYKRSPSRFVSPRATEFGSKSGSGVSKVFSMRCRRAAGIAYGRSTTIRAAFTSPAPDSPRSLSKRS